MSKDVKLIGVDLGGTKVNVGLVEGEASELEAQTYRKVDSVTLAGTGGKIVLNLNGGSAMALEDVVEVSEGDI